MMKFRLPVVSLPERRSAPGTHFVLLACGVIVAGLCLIQPLRVHAQTPPKPRPQSHAVQPADNLVELLSQMQSAARDLDYSGVYVHNHNGAMVSSRIVHVIDGTGERERLQILDGPAREYIHHNNTIQCLVPDKQKVFIEKERTDRFPGLLLSDPDRIPANYEARMNVARQRVAGRECSVTDLQARDANRYHYRICTDVHTNLLLKVETLNPERKIVEQIVFTMVDIDKDVPHELLAPSWDTKEWQVVEAVMEPVDLARQGWRIPYPPGFEPAMQVTRTMRNDRQVSQMVLTDGLAAVSVFIEPVRGASGDAFESSQLEAGAVNIFRTRIGDHWMTVLGEVPAPTLRSIAERTEFVPLAR